MKRILVALVLSAVVSAPAFAVEEDASTLSIITNVFATQVSVASGTISSVRLGLNGTVPSVVINKKGESPVVLTNSGGALEFTGGLVPQKKTLAQLDVLTPATTGQIMGCSDCNFQLSVSSGIGAGAWLIVGSSFTHIN